MSADELQSPEVMARCISAIEERLARGWDVVEPARVVHRVGEGQLLLMPGWDRAALAVKVTSVLPDGVARDRPRLQGVLVVFELPEMTPVMLVDAAGVTALRTPAMSAVATKYLAAANASRLVVFGTGPQAVRHVEAMRLVRDIAWVGIVGRTPESAEPLAACLRASGVDAEAVSSDAVADTDLVCACTTSRTPIFDGSLLPARVHVNAVGSHEPSARELDAATFDGAMTVVDSVEMALREAGDVLAALESRALQSETTLVSLDAVVRGESPYAGAARTIFKSVGTAGQDLIAGELLLELLAPERERR
ncbi:MAG: ornithine cyclodeaminase family protein [Actinomycetota bacterium]|nr:ornithine cyclodeaminase family protein [Actinomycetota bacterium]